MKQLSKYKKTTRGKGFVEWRTQDSITLKSTYIYVYSVKPRTQKLLKIPKWIVEIHKDINPMKSKSFKTKPKALAYAKSYMKSHPRG